MSAYELSVAMEQVQEACRKITEAISTLHMAGEHQAAEELVRTECIVSMDLKLLSYRRNEIYRQTEHTGA